MNRLVRRQGYAGTGLNQLMAEADAPKGSMYFHFPGGKEELAAAAIDDFSDWLSTHMARHLAEASTVSEAVAGFFDADLTYLERTEFREGCPVATVALEAAATHEALAAAVQRAFGGWVGQLAEALEAEDYPADQAHGLATVVIATIEGAIVMSKGQRSTEPLAVARDTICNLLDRAERKALAPTE
jgi:TetR/AcrR family transcriptional repressor of lmrAB and yxaGH operons